MTDQVQHPKPWWYRLAEALCPGRCREVPEAANPAWCGPECWRFDGNAAKYNDDGSCAECGAPPRIVLRQVALIKRYVYLQQFACAEDERYMHSHPFRRMLVLGLWGSYDEHRIAGPSIRRKAPYCYTMDSSHVHHVQNPSPGHTSIFAGVGRFGDYEDGDKAYFGRPIDTLSGAEPLTVRSLWVSHIRRAVKRI